MYNIAPKIGELANGLLGPKRSPFPPVTAEGYDGSRHLKHAE